MFLGDICCDICGAHCCQSSNFNNIIASQKGLCTQKNAFNTVNSDSYQDSFKTVEQKLDSEKIKLSIGNDKFRFGPKSSNGLDVKRVNFGTVKEFPESYENLPYDGILGLGRTGPNGVRAPIRSVLDTTKQTVVTLVIEKNVTTSVTTGLLNIGQLGKNSCAFDASKYVQLLNKDEWSFNVPKAMFNGVSYSNSRWTAVLNINSPFIYLPKDLFGYVSKHIIGSYDKENDTYLVYCSNAEQALRDSYIYVGQQHIALKSEFILQKGGATTCVLNIRQSPEEKPYQFTLGRPFLNNRCTFLDYSGRIGFGAVQNC